MVDDVERERCGNFHTRSNVELLLLFRACVILVPTFDVMLRTQRSQHHYPGHIYTPDLLPRYITRTPPWKKRARYRLIEMLVIIACAMRSW
jgi:spore maturation protein SpmA